MSIAKALMAGTCFPRACGCLSTRSMFLVSVWGVFWPLAGGGWKQTWDPVSLPPAGSAGPAGEGPRGFCALVLSVTGKPAESWWWEGLQEAWSSFWVCCGVYSVSRGLELGCCQRATGPLVIGKPCGFWLEEEAGLSFSPGVAEVRRCPMGLVGLYIQPHNSPASLK